MKHFFFIAALVGAVVSAPAVVQAQSNSTTAPAADVAEKEKASLNKHIKPILAALNLPDPAQETRMHDLLASYFKSLNAWHAEQDAHLKVLWAEFNQARGQQNAANADAALAKIDNVYASFKPQHEKLIADLSSVLSPEQIETVEDVLTINKVKITFNAYGEIFHGLTDEQKAFILKDLKAAREEAIDAKAMTEKSAFFKKYKIKIEAYLTAQGYDVRQSYRDFIAEQKMKAAAQKAKAATSANK